MATKIAVPVRKPSTVDRFSPTALKKAFSQEKSAEDKANRMFLSSPLLVGEGVYRLNKFKFVTSKDESKTVNGEPRQYGIFELVLVTPPKGSEVQAGQEIVWMPIINSHNRTLLSCVALLASVALVPFSIFDLNGTDEENATAMERLRTFFGKYDGEGQETEFNRLVVINVVHSQGKNNKGDFYNPRGFRALDDAGNELPLMDAESADNFIFEDSVPF